MFNESRNPIKPIEMGIISLGPTVDQNGFPTRGHNLDCFGLETGLNVGTVCLGLPVSTGDKDPKPMILNAVKKDGFTHDTIHIVITEGEDVLFNEMKVLWWWTHLGLEEAMRIDIKNFSSPQELTVAYRKYKELTWRFVREVIEPDGLLYNSPEVHVYEPLTFSAVAKIIKQLHPSPPKLIAHNLVPFPSPDDFQLFKETAESNLGCKQEQIDRQIGAYLTDWLFYDHIFFYSERDRRNFEQSIARYVPLQVLGCETLKPIVSVIPKGVDMNKISEILKEGQTDNVQTRLRTSILESSAASREESSQGIDSIDQLEGKVILADIGTRADPVKLIPRKLDAFDSFLENNPDQQGNVVLVQQIRPHRQNNESYRRESEIIVEKAIEINRKYIREGWQPIILINGWVPNGDVINIFNLLSRKAERMGILFIGKEGMGRSAQEGIFASQENTALILAKGSGLYEYLGDANLFAIEENPSVEEISQTIDDFIKTLLETIRSHGERARVELRSLDHTFRIERMKAIIRDGDSD